MKAEQLQSLLADFSRADINGFEFPGDSCQQEKARSFLVPSDYRQLAFPITDDTPMVSFEAEGDEFLFRETELLEGVIDEEGRLCARDVDGDMCIIQFFEESPIRIDQESQLRELVKEGREALDGDSNDAEHDALYSLVNYLE